MQLIKQSYKRAQYLVAILFFGSILLSGCSSLQTPFTLAENLQLTSITSSPTNVYHPGKFVWHDLLTPDIQASKKFYSALFGWTYEQHGAYTVIFNKQKKIGGMAEIKIEAKKETQSIWLAYMSITDVDEATKFIKAQGGIIHQGPVNMKNRGRGVLVSDPQGAQLLLLKTSDGDPVDSEAVIGDWLWNEIWTNVPKTTIAFYQQLGKYTLHSENNNYQILKSEGKWRAGIRDIFEDDFKVRWVTSVRVADPEVLLDKVENLGGVVWVRPDDASSNGDTALISDNTGALLMIQRWSKQSIVKGE
ncbi:MAG: VOC family protein [Pseudomonadota bacterium]